MARRKARKTRRRVSSRRSKKLLPYAIVFGVVIIIALVAFAPTGKFAEPEMDSDGDGLTDEEEAIWGSDPNNPDTDGDGCSDGFEVESQTDLLVLMDRPADCSTPL